MGAGSTTNSWAPPTNRQFVCRAGGNVGVRSGITWIPGRTSRQLVSIESGMLMIPGILCVLCPAVYLRAHDGSRPETAYSASKGAIVGMTLPVARDLSSVGIRICTICPVTFDTPLLGRLADDIKQTLAAAIPYPRRLGRSDEFAMLVEHIVVNPYLNGETIRLDGALRMAPK